MNPERYRDVIWIALGLAVLVGCDRTKTASEPERPRPVVAHVVGTPSSTVERSFSGVTSAADSAELGFEVGGRIIEVAAVRGRRYTEGAVLARLDVSTYAAEQRSAQAESTRATDELKRVQQLYESDNVSRAQLDSAIAAQKRAAAALETAQKRLADGTLRMPYAGSVGEVLRESQEVVSAGTPVVRLQGEGLMEIEIGVPADVLPRMSIGLAARVTLGSLPGEMLRGAVSKISREASSDTTYAVTVQLDQNGFDLRDGLDGEVTFELPNPRGAVVMVPSTCVAALPGGDRYVWELVDEGAGLVRARRRSVRVGSLRPGGRLEVLEGVAPGVRLVARGVHRGEEGLQLRVPADKAAAGDDAR